MREKYMNYLKDLVRVFEDTLEILKKYFKIPSSKKYEVKKIKIIWSEDTVKSIFELSGKIATLNFADDTIAKVNEVDNLILGKWLAGG